MGGESGDEASKACVAAKGAARVAGHEAACEGCKSASDFFYARSRHGGQATEGTQKVMVMRVRKKERKKRHKQTIGWEEDKVPTCTSRIL